MSPRLGVLLAAVHRIARLLRQRERFDGFCLIVVTTDRQKSRPGRSIEIGYLDGKSWEVVS